MCFVLLCVAYVLLIYGCFMLHVLPIHRARLASGYSLHKFFDCTNLFLFQVAAWLWAHQQCSGTSVGDRAGRANRLYRQKIRCLATTLGASTLYAFFGTFSQLHKSYQIIACSITSVRCFYQDIRSGSLFISSTSKVQLFQSCLEVLHSIDDNPNII